MSRKNVSHFTGLIAGITVWAVFVAGSGSAFSYDVVSGFRGGSLSGSVKLIGTPPPARIFHLIVSPNPDFCGRISDGKGNRLLPEFRVGSDGGFADVVVALVGVPRGKPFDYEPSIEVRDCRMGPWVTPVRPRLPFAMVNRDPIAHDIQGYTLKGSYTFPMFNQPIEPLQTSSRPIRFRPGHYLFRTQCGVHAFMQSWGIAVTNPYFAVTGENGKFEISDIPPGEYDLIVWHPHMAIQASTVRIEADSASTVAFEFDAGEAGIPLHDLQTGYRFDTVPQPHQIPPPLELQ